MVNAIVALLATGGSTNHTMHLVSMAAAAGIDLTWQDFADLSSVVPLLARIYPNGSADINQFQQAGGSASLFAALLEVGLMHEDVLTVAGPGLGALLRGARSCVTGRSSRGPRPLRAMSIRRCCAAPSGRSPGTAASACSRDRSDAASSRSRPSPARRASCEAPARVFDDQQQFLDAFARDELTGDAVIVVRFQGPRANGMPELHRLTPALGVLQGRGQRVALVTDGRMSGASGKVPAVDPLHAGGRRRRSARPDARRRQHPHRHARRSTSTCSVSSSRRATAPRCPAAGMREPAASCSDCSATP